VRYKETYIGMTRAEKEVKNKGWDSELAHLKEVRLALQQTVNDASGKQAKAAARHNLKLHKRYEDKRILINNYMRFEEKGMTVSHRWVIKFYWRMMKLTNTKQWKKINEESTDEDDDDEPEDEEQQDEPEDRGDDGADGADDADGADADDVADGADGADGDDGEEEGEDGDDELSDDDE
jgi:hypothetical protein